MITNRLKVYLSVVIGQQQSGYIPGRFISLNIRKLIEIIAFLEREDQAAVLIAVDFKKCFDSIEHEAMYSALREFNLGEYLISWVKMVYNNF